MKYSLKIFLVVAVPFLAKGQQNADSLKKIFLVSEDSVRYNVSRFIYSFYEESNRDSALHYADQNLQLARKYNKKLAEAISLDNKGYQFMGMGRDSEALQCFTAGF
jgi:hypothetical protein